MHSPQMMADGRPVPAKMVLANRVIWAAMLSGQVVFAFVAVSVRQADPPRRLPVPAVAWVTIDAGLMAAAVGICLAFGRRAFRSDAEMAQKYGPANILPLGALEAASFFGLVGVLFTGAAWPLGVVPAISFVTQLLRFPPSRFHVRP